MATGERSVLTRPDTISNEAEFGASEDFYSWGHEQFARRNISANFHRSICNATAQILMGQKCAVIQDAGPLEWDVAAICVIAREAGAYVYMPYIDTIDDCARYAAVITWDKELFDIFYAKLLQRVRTAAKQ
jgi:fructose-1,6-bisphosphatase/inositol monophosphatase family enzyme